MEIENNRPERQETVDLKLKGDPMDLTGFKEAILWLSAMGWEQKPVFSELKKDIDDEWVGLSVEIYQAVYTHYLHILLFVYYATIKQSAYKFCKIYLNTIRCWEKRKLMGRNCGNERMVLRRWKRVDLHRRRDASFTDGGREKEEAMFMGADKLGRE